MFKRNQKSLRCCISARLIRHGEIQGGDREAVKSDGISWLQPGRVRNGRQRRLPLNTSKNRITVSPCLSIFASVHGAMISNVSRFVWPEQISAGYEQLPADFIIEQLLRK